MMTHNTMKGIFSAALVFFLPVFAGAETITLEQVRNLALAASRSLAKYNLQIQSNALDVKSQRFSNLPSLSLGADASMRVLNNDWSPIEKPLDASSVGVNLGASITYNIFEGGKTVVQTALNSIASEMTKKDALAEFFNVLDSADNAYYAALEAAASLESEELALQTAGTSLSMAEIRQAGGMINQGDYLKALAEKETREAARNQARRNLALSAAKLKAITGLDALPALEPIDFNGYENLIQYLGGISDEDAALLYGELWKLLAAGNPSLIKAGLNSRRAEQNLTKAKWDYAPTLSASISPTGLSYSSDKGLGTTVGGFSINGRIPLDFWVMANNVEKNKIALESAALDYISQQSALEIELQTALLNTIAQAGTVLSAGRSLEYAEKHFEYVMERYRLSQSSVSDLLDATALAGNSRNQLIKSRYGFLRSLSKLRSLGALDDESTLTNILMGAAQ